MTGISFRLRTVAFVAAIAAPAMLVGCGPSPVTTSTTTTEQHTVTPAMVAPAASTTTTTTEQVRRP